jgi:pimeloyl-ACP methyl ester carboxylesterase
METTEVYLLAGLGFDKRIFQNLILENVKVNYLEWLEPAENESLDNYVDRIAEQISPTAAPIVLIGHSFGGIIVQKISRLINPAKVIIISSIKSKSEMPISLKVLKSIPIYNYINKELILKSFPLWARIFGYNSEKGRLLFNQMIGSSSDNYLRWSLDKIANIEFKENIHNLVHIHGTRDKTFSIKKIKDPIIIEDGSHFMVFSKGDEISETLNNEILKIAETY